MARNTAKIENALIQWGSNKSRKDGTESFSFNQNFSNSPAVSTNRTKGNVVNILPVVAADTDVFKVNRNDGIDGEQPFNWLAIGGETSNRGVSPVIQDNQQIALIQWGKSTSRADSTEYFPFNQIFNTGCYTVFVQRMSSGSKYTFPVTEIDLAGFRINRNDDIDGYQDFFWIAIGDCDIVANNCFEFNLGSSNYKLKGGSATSTRDSSQSFTFQSLGLSKFPNSCSAVITNRTRGIDVLPVDSMASNQFTVNRNDDIDGNQNFYWLALGN